MIIEKQNDSSITLVVSSEEGSLDLHKLLKKYRHVVLQHSGFGIVGFRGASVNTAETLSNNTLMQIMQRMRSCTVLPSDRDNELQRVSVTIPKGDVDVSKVCNNHVSFYNNDEDWSIFNPIEVTLEFMLYKSSTPVRRLDENTELMLSDTDMEVVVSQHGLVLECFVDETSVTLTCVKGLEVKTVLQEALVAVKNEIDAISINTLFSHN